MKFTDLIVMGSTLISFDPTMYLEGECGCLIGMAAAAAGDTYLTAESMERWPWLFKRSMVQCPQCRASFSSLSGAISCVAAHVYMEDMTFEQALEYIRSVEPVDESLSLARCPVEVCVREER